jgi:hypothetical protein
MTYDGRGAVVGDAVAAGPYVGGPAGAPDAAPALHHHPAFLAAHPERTGSGYRQRPGGASPRPARQSRSIRVPAGARAKEVPMA